MPVKRRFTRFRPGENTKGNKLVSCYVQCQRGQKRLRGDPAIRPVMQMAHPRRSRTPRKVGCYTFSRCTGQRSEEELARWITYEKWWIGRDVARLWWQDW